MESWQQDWSPVIRADTRGQELYQGVNAERQGMGMFWEWRHSMSSCLKICHRDWGRPRPIDGAKCSQEWLKKGCQGWDFFKPLAFYWVIYRRLEINVLSCLRGLNHYLSGKKYLGESHWLFEEAPKNETTKYRSWKNQEPRLSLLSINETLAS